MEITLEMLKRGLARQIGIKIDETETTEKAKTSKSMEYKVGDDEV